jgi:beta-glucosidase
VNAYASGISVGASWNKNLAYQRARAMGGEFRTKGANVALGPVVGPLGRVVEGGRNWEGFSNDPYLCGSLAFETVQGIQEKGVITSTKVCILQNSPSIFQLLTPIALYRQ